MTLLLTYRRSMPRSVAAVSAMFNAATIQGEWFTYEQAAELLNLSRGAVRQRAVRGRWQKTLGNDKRIRIRLPEAWPDSVRPGKTKSILPADATQLIKAQEAHIKALEAHIETLKAQLFASDARAERVAAQLSEEKSKQAARLLAERMKTDAERAKTEAERANAEKAVAWAQRLEATVEALERELESGKSWRRLLGGFASFDRAS